jgi:sec-independent protein translocase protein TatB
MLDIGWSELILIGIVALIVVGPKDLPRMFHALGRMTSKARGMAREFQRAMDDAAKTAGLDEVRKDLNAIRSSTSSSALGIDVLENAASKFEKWDPTKGVKAAAATANPTLAAAPTTSSVVTMAPPVVVPNMPAPVPAPVPAADAAASTTGPATAALAEQKAAEQAAARQKTLELQAKRTETAAKKFAEKAAEKTKAEAAAAAAQPVAPEPAATAASEPLAESTGAAADAKPARKPPARRKNKKSDA